MRNLDFAAAAERGDIAPGETVNIGGVLVLLVIPGIQVQLLLAVAVIHAEVTGEKIGVQVAVAGIVAESIHQSQPSFDIGILAEGEINAGRDIKDRIARLTGRGENVVICADTYHARGEKLGPIANCKEWSGINYWNQGEPNETQAR